MSIESPIHWQHFAHLIRAASKIALFVHQRPDADCIGCGIAMYRILTYLGKDVLPVSPHQVPPSLQFLDPAAVIKAFDTLTEKDKQRLNEVDTILVLDTSSWQQLGECAEIFRRSQAKKLILDHHIKTDDIGAERFVDAGAEATGALVLKAAEVLNVPLVKEIADPLFAALATDTGWFRFSSVQPETYRRAAVLMEGGADPAELYRQLYEQESPGRLRLIGRVMSKVESFLDGRLLLTHILSDDFDAAGALASDSEDLVNMLLRVKGTQMAVLMSEIRVKEQQSRPPFKISFRSRCAIDCCQLAMKFGGGGHAKAAGATSMQPFAETKQAVIDSIGEAFARFAH